MFLALMGRAWRQHHAPPLRGDRLAVPVKQHARQAEAGVVAGGDETRQRANAQFGC
jgi:hypothetical protein